ncbi:SAG1386/EF1546 family surface-associated protein [Streptococcus iniae]|uniref:SAG1386/EF1546 family surface-associated protein n=1 Tax=Streptococcus iniae TaxID=1346 RepID=UPI002B27DAF8|nr:LysM domain-containing protein [Streptococcus iniae]WNZ89256.1 LysM domain-containing protein [Streptococcus iniae]WNZ95048.1 LysM domain-containing protein [Streptococcus iniae]WNZ95400.1 LysM domain-containing protein [Streptococcus iniae]
MANEPWEEKIVNDSKKTRVNRSRVAFLSTPWLTALLSVFFVIIVGILFIFFYTSNSGGDKQTDTSGFYGVSSSKTEKKSTPKTSKSSEETATTTETTPSSSEVKKGETITVLAGEGATSIAGRAGITVEQLQALNPDHMTQGYWYANPGDAVYIN